MPRYITYFSYSGGAVKAMIDHPTDRAAAAKALVEAVGGKMEGFYWMQGAHDGLFISELPDSEAAAAVSAAAGATGAIVDLESHQLFDAADRTAILKKAKKAAKAYTPPTT